MPEEDFRRYLDAMLERHVTITAELIAAMHKGFADLSEATHALQAEIADQREQIQASTAWIRAQTEAILRMIDRFPPTAQEG